MAGLFQLSLQQILDDFGQPLHGNLTFFYETGTLDPLPVFTDYGCTVPATNPVIADGFGRIPAVYLADGGSGFYRFRVTTAEGAIVPGLDLQTLPVLTPGTGGGPPPTSPVDPATLNQTGDFTFTLLRASVVRVGWVRANGNSIGNASSGATEQATDATLALYTHLWTACGDDLCPVSGGRGASANADFTAAKRLTLPDLRGRSPFGTDRMGNSVGLAGRLTAATITGTGLGPDITGSYGGLEKVALTTVTQLPAHTHTAGTLLVGNESAHTHPAGALAVSATVVQSRTTVSRTPGGNNVSEADAPTALTISGNTGPGSAHSHTLTGSSGSTGSGSTHNNLSPALLGTWRIKL